MIAGHDDHRHAAPGERRLRRGDRDSPCLPGLRRGVRRTPSIARRCASDRPPAGNWKPVSRALDVRGDQHHRRAVAVALEDAVDEMQAARSGGAGAHREFARSCRPRRRPRVRPPPRGGHAPSRSSLSAHRVGEVVDGVADDAVAPLRAGRRPGHRSSTSATLVRVRAMGCLPWVSVGGSRRQRAVFALCRAAGGSMDSLRPERMGGGARTSAA